MKLMMFTRKNCANCPPAKEIVGAVAINLNLDVAMYDADNIPFEVLHTLLNNQIYIFSVPALIVENENKLNVVFAGMAPNEKDLEKKLNNMLKSK